MQLRRRVLIRVLSAAGLIGAMPALAAAPRAEPPAAQPVPACEATPPASFCRAVRGVRAEGWAPQSRSEVMAQHGMVAASQPLAAQAGLSVMKGGGNAIAAAVATSAVLSITEPMMVGVASDLFAVVYIAKDHKVYVL